MANANLFSQSDKQRLPYFYLFEPVGMDSIVEAPTKDLVLDWVLKESKNHHSHLPGFQIVFNLQSSLCLVLEAYIQQNALGSVFFVSQRFLHRLNQSLNQLPCVRCLVCVY